MTIEMIVALIGASVVAYAIANRFRLIAPVLLIVAGVGVALLPVGEEMSLPSTVVLTIFLPILLYWESLSVSLNRMRRSLRGIILSATVLVAITAALITLIGVLTGLSVGAALLIGACLGPTDATAVSSLGRGINPNGRTVLQAESLLNDGTALVIFAIALQAAQDSSGVTFGLITHQLLLSFGGGIGAGVLVGAAVTKIGIRVRTIKASARSLRTAGHTDRISGRPHEGRAACGRIIGSTFFGQARGRQGPRHVIPRARLSPLDALLYGMMQRNDLDGILDLLRRQQAALASQAPDAVDRLDSIHAELQKQLLRLQPVGRRQPSSPGNPVDRRKAADIAQLLVDNRALMLRLSDNNRRALETIFKTQPLVYTR